MSYSVYLSPSAQERNIGAGAYGTEEKRMNQIADVVKAVLERHGITVYRNNPEWSLAEIVDDSNSRHPDLHFAIHSNAGGGEGCEVFAYSAASSGEKAAKMIYSQLEPLTPAKDRGIKYSTALYELRLTMAPAVLVEVGFHDNPVEAVWIMNNTSIIGTALAVGALRYLGVEYNENGLEKDTKPDGIRGFINENGVNLRRGPGTKMKIIGRLNKGDSVKLLKHIRVWWHVEFKDQKGYVYDRYVSMQEQEKNKRTT